MLLFTAAIAVILLVLQSQCDLLLEARASRTVKIILFVLAIVAVIYQRYG